MLPFNRARSSRLRTTLYSRLAGLVYVPRNCPFDYPKSGGGSPVSAPVDLLSGGRNLDGPDGILGGATRYPAPSCGRQYQGTNYLGQSHLQDFLDLPGDSGAIHQGGTRVPRLVHK
jgi:hypothetical protein